jgi:DNA topoisomerase VI subunit B
MNTLVHRIRIAEREIFTTSRSAEFCTRRELEKQTSHDAENWPLYVVKELLDNGLDVAEEARISPEIDIEIGNNRISVTDNGPGIAADTVKRLLDLSSRTSARERYISPTRGAQGQALSTILVMPHALDPGGNGAVIIEAQGIAHQIAVHVHKLTEQPRFIHNVADSSVKTGSRITIGWPQSASTILEDGHEQILPLTSAYSLTNPHLTLTLRRLDQDHPDVWPAMDRNWSKWRACDPTSPHWYSPESFRRLVGSYIEQDQTADRRRPLRDFLGLFDGISSTTRRGKILAAVGLSRAVLNDMLRDGEPDCIATANLLRAMQEETKPVKPARLGIIGETNLARLKAIGMADSFRYARAMGMDNQGLPYVVEGAFIWAPRQSSRRLIVGANFATAPRLSLDLGCLETARDVLAQRHAGQAEPVAVFLHITHPRLTFTDLGKARLLLPRAIASDLRKVIEKITAEWHKQRQREQRNARAEIRRQDALRQQRKTTIKESVYNHLSAVYAKVSGGIGARSRQLFYGLRPHVLAETGLQELDDAYIMYGLIPDFIAENPKLCADWIVFYDDRGHLIEPHTGKIIGLGTRSVRNYCSQWSRPIISDFELSSPRIETHGPSGRYGAILFTEKEGFNDLFEAVGLPARFDLALASTKGTSVTAARELFEVAAHDRVPIFALHDFDYNGFEIAATLRRNTRRYQFAHPPEIIDIGLRLVDVQQFGLQSEPVAFGNRNREPLRKNLTLNGATEDEIAFLIARKQRVELNAMTSPQLIELIEAALIQHRVCKVIPEPETLSSAYRSRIEYSRAKKALRAAIVTARHKTGQIAVPDDLTERVLAYLKANPSKPWEAAIRTIAEAAV